MCGQLWERPGGAGTRSPSTTEAPTPPRENEGRAGVAKAPEKKLLAIAATMVTLREGRGGDDEGGREEGASEGSEPAELCTRRPTTVFPQGGPTARLCRSRPLKSNDTLTGLSRLPLRPGDSVSRRSLAAGAADADVAAVGSSSVRSTTLALTALDRALGPACTPSQPHQRSTLATAAEGCVADLAQWRRRPRLTTASCRARLPSQTA